MSKTYFVISDVHSFYGPMQQALWKAGFRRTNKNHILICCGDIFDRGPDSLYVYDYIRKLPESRRVLIRGNHEDLYLELALSHRLPYLRDFVNGTVKTFCEIAGTDYQFISLLYYGFEVDEVVDEWYKTQEIVKNSDVTKWILSNEWKNYFELGQFVFVHSFVPIKLDEVSHSLDKRLPIGEYDPYWRIAPKEAWDAARWGCPYEKFDAGYFKPETDAGKILVCGHWHARDFHEHYEKDLKSENNTTYQGKNLIALDACTLRSGIVNVLTISEETIKLD